MGDNWLGSEHPSPYEQMQSVLTGALHHDAAPVAIQSVCRLQFYHAAKEILAMPFEKRRMALMNVPEGCRKQVENEIRRLHKDANR